VSTFSDHKKRIVLSAYTTAGKKLWNVQAPQVSGPPFIEVNGFEQYVKFSSKCFESQFNTFDHLLASASGTEVTSGFNSQIATVLNSRFLVFYKKYNPIRYQSETAIRPHSGEPLSAQRAWFSYDVPRVSCRRLRLSRYHWVSGEYIYSDNKDRCGRYTLQFHWIDQRRPKPEVILAGLCLDRLVFLKRTSELRIRPCTLSQRMAGRTADVPATVSSFQVLGCQVPHARTADPPILRSDRIRSGP